MEDSFWKNWTWKKTQWPSGAGFVELEFFGNNFNHVESTGIEGAKRLGLSDMRMSPCRGGGYIAKLTQQIEGI